MAEKLTNDEAFALIASGVAKIDAGQAEILMGTTALQANMLPPVIPPADPDPPIKPPEPVNTVTVKSLDELTKVAAAAKQPTQINLTSGKHGILTLKNLKATALTIVLAGATLQGIRVQASENISISKALSVLDGTGSQVQVTDSSGVTFTDCETTDGPKLYGFSALRSKKVAFIRCRAQRVKDGFQANGCDGLIIKDAYARRTAADGMTFAACSNVHVDGFDASEIGSGGHPDVIQFFTKGTTAPSKNILIENVRYVRGVGATQAQGIFLTDQVGTLPYENVVIRNCSIIGGMYNGIMVSNGINVAVNDNEVIPYTDMDSRVQMNNIKGGSVTGNKFTKILQDGVNTGLVIKDNTTIKPIPVPAAA